MGRFDLSDDEWRIIPGRQNDAPAAWLVELSFKRQ